MGLGRAIFLLLFFPVSVRSWGLRIIFFFYLHAATAMDLRKKRVRKIGRERSTSGKMSENKKEEREMELNRKVMMREKKD